jgi:predicted metal-dependent peptidase
MAAEQIYNLLAAARQKGGQGQKPGNQPGGGGQPQPGGGQGGQPGSMPAFGEMEQPAQTADPAAQKQLASDWQGTLLQSAMIAKGRGELPGSLERLINECVSPTVHWTEIVASWLREQCADDWDFLTPAMEYSVGDFILPSLRSDKVGEIIFAADTSGSTSDQIPEFQSNMQACLDELKPRKLTVIYADSAVQRIDEYGQGDTISPNFPGGGGTDFRPVFEHIAAMDRTPKCLVYLTDLDGRFPEADPGYPVLWVVKGGGAAPFGEVIEIKG